MAATKRNAMLIAEARFYVYRLLRDGVTVYVGKGSGRRLQSQMRRYGLPGEIIKRFKREAGAYAFEIKMIAALAPSLNKHPGGNGPWAEERPVYPEFDRIIADIGARAYAARLWLACAKAAPHMVDLSKLDALKAVAYGSRV